MQFGNRIKSLRIKKGITQRKLADMINVSTVTIGNWEAGIKQPSMKAIIALATALDVTTDFLLGVDMRSNIINIKLSLHETEFLENYRMLDSHGKQIVDAVFDIEFERMKAKNNSDGYLDIINNAQTPIRYIPKYLTPSAAGISVPLDGQDFEMIPIDQNVPKNADFAVRIQGDSMSPYINDGSIVYVQKKCELNNGDIGIFCVNDAMYCKQFYIDKDGVLNLLSSNPELKSTNLQIHPEYSDSVRCYGKVLLDKKIPLPKYFTTIMV